MRQLVGPEQSSHRDRGHVNAERAAGGARTDPVQDDTGLGEPPHSPGIPAQEQEGRERDETLPSTGTLRLSAFLLACLAGRAAGKHIHVLPFVSP
ncbi:hypothetical protein KUCAC02_024672 [Chaenocephalus aceratus]|uniref:Uncharacterized protein n=1 Tax=Chaenocephalus aceratus TaxID=36190 RepID=A0ACB9WIK8_CHAAC|nr:hypothetical protein KUCAC02_024672 [Chaenocephalus aceratus]